jgi:hypothetical protein
MAVNVFASHGPDDITCVTPRVKLLRPNKAFVFQCYQLASRFQPGVWPTPISRTDD